MSTAMEELPPSALKGLELFPAEHLALRRDLHRFVGYVQRKALRRTYRGNHIPSKAAAELEGLLSWKGEAEKRTDYEGIGCWSDFVSRVARVLGLVRFDIKGSYVGYSSQDPVFSDNDITVDTAGYQQWLAKPAVQKEQALLEVVLRAAGNEFFSRPEHFYREPRFDDVGSATGPVSRMKLVPLRRALLALLASLPAGVWLPFSALASLVETQHRNLILPPELKKGRPEKAPSSARKTGRNVEAPPADLEDDSEKELDLYGDDLEDTPDRRPAKDLYQNFNDTGKQRGWDEAPVLTEQSPDVFARVEARYLQYFLQTVPSLCSYVDLAQLPLPSKSRYPTGPLPLERVRAFRVSPRLARVLAGDATLDQATVRVLPDHEVHVECESFPERELAVLEPLCAPMRSEGTRYVLRLDRKRVLQWSAATRNADPVGAVRAVCTSPLPENVAAELSAWGGHAEKLEVLDGLTLVEVRADLEAVRAELGKLVAEEKAPAGFLFVTNPVRTVSVLAQRERIPLERQHGPERFAEGDGPLSTPAQKPAASEKDAKRAPAKGPARRRVSYRLADLVALESEDKSLLARLRELLERTVPEAKLDAKGHTLLVPAKELAKLRDALRKTEVDFDLQEDP